MIDKREILDQATATGLNPHVVEKDYVLGWLLWGVANHQATTDAWIFKGGTSLKKCFFETYRFSEDLDFTLSDDEQLDEDFLRGVFADIADNHCRELCPVTNVAELLRTPPPSRRPQPRDGIGQATLAFFEAYFSNYIEGTEFTPEEAEEIVFRGRIPAQRPADAHDVLGVWRIVSDLTEMRRVPHSAGDFLDLLRERHAAMLAKRPDAAPGQFKTAPNRVGAVEFVRPDAVVGTLERGFEMDRTLDTPFRRAAFIHFLVSEVHPFADGNGRVARMMMTAELVAGDQERIVIPTVYRDNYIAGQRAMTAGHGARAMLRMLDFAWGWTAAVPWRGFETTMTTLRGCHAFDTAERSDRLGTRLAMPPAPGGGTSV